MGHSSIDETVGETASQSVTVLMHGRVFPDATKISTRDLGSITINEHEHDIDIVASLSILASNITVSFQISSWKPELFNPIAQHALRLSRAAISILGFKSGEGLEAQIYGWTTPAGDFQFIRFAHDELSMLATSLGTKNGFDTVVRFAMIERDIYLAVTDMVAGISGPEEEIINHARAADAIRNLISGKDVSTPAGWARMRQDLNVTREYIELITSNSANHRHGDRIFIPINTQIEIRRRSWTLMDRYFHYRIGGSQPLTGQRFPLLVG